MILRPFKTPSTVEQNKNSRSNFYSRNRKKAVIEADKSQTQLKTMERF